MQKKKKKNLQIAASYRDALCVSMATLCSFNGAKADFFRPGLLRKERFEHFAVLFRVSSEGISLWKTEEVMR